MPKEKETRLLFWARINRKYPGVFKTHNSVGYCTICHCAVQARKLFSVQQHMNTNKHKIAALNYTPSEVATGTLEDFKNPECDFEVSKSFLEAKIPLTKMEHPSIKELLEKHTDCNLATLQQKVVPKIYKDTIKQMQSKVKKGEYIWISIDCVEIDQQLIVNFIFGILDPNGIGRDNCYLLNAAIMNDIDPDSMSSFFVDSLALLWPNGIQYDNIMVCVTSRDSNMIKAIAGIKSTFPKMLHITCFAQSFHRVGEYIRAQFPDVNNFISNLNTTFLMAPYHRQLLKKYYPHLSLPPNPCITRWCSWLKAAIYYSNNYTEIKSVVSEFENDDAESIVLAKKLLNNEKIKMQLTNLKRNFSVLVRGSERVEQKHRLPLQEIMTLCESVFNSISSIEQKDYIKKLQASFQKTDGYNCLVQIYKTLNDDYKPKEPYVKSLTELELSLFKFCPVILYRVEREFPLYSQLFNSHFRMFRFESLKQNLIIYCNNFDE